MRAKNDDAKAAGAENKITITLDDFIGNAGQGDVTYSVCVDGEWMPLEPGKELALEGGKKLKVRAVMSAPRLCEDYAGAEGGKTVEAMNAEREENAVPGAKGVALDWTCGEEGASYNIYRGGSREDMALLASGLKDTSYTDKDISFGQAYYYRITACGQKPPPEEGARKKAPVRRPADFAGCGTVLSRGYPEVPDWQNYVYFKPERRGAYNYDLNPIFLRRLAALAKACLKEKLYVTWGYRTGAEQALQYHVYQKHNGSPADAPGTDWHEHRLAADVQTYTIRRLSNSALEKFGLIKPVAGKNHHIQPIETQGIPVSDRAEFAKKANAGFTFDSDGADKRPVQCPYCGETF